MCFLVLLILPFSCAECLCRESSTRISAFKHCKRAKYLHLFSLSAHMYWLHGVRTSASVDEQPEFEDVWGGDVRDCGVLRCWRVVFIFFFSACRSFSSSAPMLKQTSRAENWDTKKHCMKEQGGLFFFQVGWQMYFCVCY